MLSMNRSLCCGGRVANPSYGQDGTACWRIALAVLFGVSSILAPLRFADAHEGHAALPSTGAAIDGDQLLLSDAAIEAVKVETARIGLGDIHQTLNVNAHVELPMGQWAQVATLIEGRIASVLVKPGERVHAGQELARIESPEFESLEYQLLEIAAEVEFLQRLVQERQTLADRGGIPGSELLKTQLDLQRKQAEQEILRLKLIGWGLDSSEVDQLLASQELIRSIAVTSPIDGIVRQVDARPGQLVEATDHLFEVVDPSRVYLVGEVLESDTHLVSEGMSITATFTSLARRNFGGVIDHLHLHVHEPDRTLHIVAILDNDDLLLRPGMLGTMTINVATVTQEILCPLDAVIEREDGAYVLRRESEGKFSLRPVTLGMRGRDKAVATSGLFPGQEVIVSGTHLLAAMFDAAESRRDSVADRSTPSSRHSSDAPQTSTVAAAAALVELPPNETAFAASLIEGRLEEVLVSPGEKVSAGQVLARIRSQPIRDIQLELLQTIVDLAWTEQEVERLTPLAAAGGVPDKDLWQREMERQTLRQRDARLGRQLALLGLPDAQMEQLRERAAAIRDGSADRSTESLLVEVIDIRAPIDGTIAEVLLSPGALVHSHDQLFEIQNPATVWIKAMMFEQDAASVAPGQSAVVTLPSHPTLRLTGDVVRVAPMLASSGRVLPVWIEVENPNGFLRNGMLASVDIHVPTESPEVASRNGGGQ